MTQQMKDPITLDRTITEPRTATAVEVMQQLASFEVDELSAQIAPFLAAAAAEVAFVADVPWRFTDDVPVVALLRLFSRAGLKSPNATGPHTQRLSEQLGRTS